jgi:hypothetical protein
MKRLVFVLALLLALCGGGRWERMAAASYSLADWVKVHDAEGKLCGKESNGGVINGKPCGVSGTALLGPPQDGRIELLVVHDAKGAGGKRLGIVTIDPKASSSVNYRPLDWPAQTAPPDDLEAVSSLPGQPGHFLAVSSSGQLFWLEVAGDVVKVVPGALLTEFMSPRPQSGVNIEGLSVQEVRGQVVIVWGHCGGGKEQGILYYGLLHLKSKQITGAVKTKPIEVNYPSPTDPRTRHIADLKVDEKGVVWASATSDPGDFGPFASAIYNLGELDTSKTSIGFKQNPDQKPSWTFEKHKVEAIELVPDPGGGIVFGAEDEDKGGWLYFEQTRDAGRGGAASLRAAPDDSSVRRCRPSR